jgi:uncharacterized membrane-anchored protein YitT (DUF2179 family)
MNKLVKNILLLLDVALIAVFVYWYITERSAEALGSLIGAIAGLIVLLFVKEKSTKLKNGMSMKQKAGHNSTQYQAGGDMTINPVKKRK